MFGFGSKKDSDSQTEQQTQQRQQAQREYIKRLDWSAGEVGGNLREKLGDDDLDGVFASFAPKITAAILRASKVPEYLDNIEYKGLYDELCQHYDARIKELRKLQKEHEIVCKKLAQYEKPVINE